MTGKAKEEAISVLGKWKDSNTSKLVVPTPEAEQNFSSDEHGMGVLTVESCVEKVGEWCFDER